MDKNTIIVNSAPYPNRKIKGIIAEREINQETLCEMAGVSRQTLCHVLSGKSTIRVDSLVKVLSALGYRMTLEPSSEQVDAPRRALSDVLSGKQAIQVDSLVKVLSALGYRLTLEPSSEQVNASAHPLASSAFRA